MMFTNVKNIIDYITETLPQLQRIYRVWYVVEDNPDYTIRVSQPSPFDDYKDIVAKVGLFYKDKLVWEVLIAQDTDLSKFCEKLKKKISNK